MHTSRKSRSRLISFLAVAAAFVLPGIAGPRPALSSMASEVQSWTLPASSSELSELMKALAADDHSFPSLEIDSAEEAHKFNANSFKPWMLER